MLRAYLVLAAGVTLAVSVSFLCSLLESALLSLSPSQLAAIRRKDGRRGELCLRLKQDIERSLAVILILNTAAHTIGAAVAGAAFAELFGSAWLGVFTLLFTLVMVQYTEILPKTLGVHYNRRVMIPAARPLSLLVKVMNPLIDLVHWVNHPFEVKRRGRQPSTVAEIAALADLARRDREISSQQEHILMATPKLSRLTAAQIMVPVENVSFISTNQTLEEALTSAHADFHTRYPVCEDGNRDKVAGYINFKELVATVRAGTGRASLKDIVRPLHWVAPDESAAELLERFAVRHVHLALVHHSGRTLGLITMEDIVEELIGDLDDEFDPLPKTFYTPSEGLWVIGGGVPLSLLAAETPLKVPRSSMAVADWFGRRVRHRPKAGEVLRFHNAEFYVRKIRRGRVLEFNVRRVGI